MARKKCQICHFFKYKEGLAWIDLWRQLLPTTQVFCQLQFFFKVQVHSTRLEFESALEKDHIWMWCFHKYYVFIFEWYVVWCGSKTGHKNDMWLEETRLRAQHLLTILGSTIDIVGGGGRGEVTWYFHGSTLVENYAQKNHNWNWMRFFWPTSYAITKQLHIFHFHFVSVILEILGCVIYC